MSTTITTINSTTSSTTLVAANSRRSSLVLRNTDPNAFYFLQGGGAASAAVATGDLGELESVTISAPECREAFSGVWAADGSGVVTITETSPHPLSGGAATYPLLAIIREVCDAIGLNRPATVIDSSDAQVRQLLALAIEEAEELSRAFPWQSLTREVTFSTTADAEQLNAVPDDLDRFIPNSFFNRTTARPVYGPVSPQQWQSIQANPAGAGVILGYRQQDRAFLLTPDPPADETIAYEYITSEWATSSDGLTTYTRWSADTDLTYLDARLIILGVRWRWKKTKGLSYAEDYDTYQMQKQQKQARDGGSSVISLVAAPSTLGRPTIPEFGFGA